jgi:glycosyltransferase involved in cell wall biosynthesis
VPFLTQNSTNDIEKPCELSLVIPAFNEGRNLGPLIDRVVPALDRISEDWELVFVDDGSSDDTYLWIAAAHQKDARIRGVSFSRNFGKEIAIAAGLDAARGQAVVIMDADLQHPPEMIGRFMELWREGYEVIYGQRVDRHTDSLARRLFTYVFYHAFAAFGETPLPDGAGDFRLLDRKAVNALRAMGERARFSKGLYAWIGFKAIGVPFDVADRAQGSSKFGLRRLLSFALDGITSFSTVPLRLWTYIGAFISGVALLMAAQVVISTLAFGADVPGYATLLVSITFFAGIQLLSLGIIGEYIGRIFAEVKRRPLYIVGKTIGFEEKSAPKPAKRRPKPAKSP